MNFLGSFALLDAHQLPGAFANWWNRIEADLLSIAASGWSAELIPDDELLQSEFPEVLEEPARIALQFKRKWPENFKAAALNPRITVSGSGWGRLRPSASTSPGRRCVPKSRSS